ncbi:hypothetical protein EOD42_11845 [Rhodovarius crocodyli]|uniref:Molybdopterin-binding oxidoreductase n=1 Tax=Rhodovarius crocodyli TaxID=1979269 RepID=A0A437MHJ0_9PROT|nr:hypothetical protein [Rhodovarius crocodyli]RVT97075.1 hypothetical protein EOD42_11845 [Rhodovarius crocodyli]
MPHTVTARRRRFCATFPPLVGLALSAGEAEAAGENCLVIRARGAREGMVLERAVLDAAPRDTLLTHTPWTAGPQRFEGRPLWRLLPDAALAATVLELEALDSYRMTLPMEDARENGLFLAWRHGGALMPVRDRGPFWLLYPWTERPALDTPLYHRRSTWQLTRLEFA